LAGRQQRGRRSICRSDLGGGTSGTGTVFRRNTDGTGFTNLHSFGSPPSPSPNTDGSRPYGRLVLSGDTLYGTASSGGASGIGTVFAVNTDGTGFTNLHSFAVDGGLNPGGSNPYGGLVLSGDMLYGTANLGGAANNGTVFAINTNGTGFTNPHSFTATLGDAGVEDDGTNSDGASPFGGLVLWGNTLYGTAQYGGVFGNGTVFALNTDGTGFTDLYSFTGVDDGSSPSASLLPWGNTLYGTAYGGSSSGAGTVFALATNGTGFTNLHSFTGGTGGSSPYNGLVLIGNALYGTVASGGDSDSGAVFSINTDGTSFTNVYSFTALPGFETGTNTDGALPVGGLVSSGSTLVGTAEYGGDFGSGTIFSLSLPAVIAPQLTIVLSGGDIILTWPATPAGFTLQSTTNLAPPAVWSASPLGAALFNGQNTVTNLTPGTQQFYRLYQ
jgi:uncharacterized repeat protein (TIGR03803 family)